MIKSFLYSKKMAWLAKALVYLGFKKPSVPHLVGESLYWKNSFWSENFSQCPCDVDFIDYIAMSSQERLSIFHMGPGGHHFLGVKAAGLHHTILAVTPAVREFNQYVKLADQDTNLSRNYKVLLTDIYNLNPADVGVYNYINLFHLCEFSSKETQDNKNFNDSELTLFLTQHLTLNGCIVFYKNSSAFEKTQKIIDDLVIKKILSYKESYKSLDFYQLNTTRENRNVSS
jgi:hypothetical protein